MLKFLRPVVVAGAILPTFLNPISCQAAPDTPTSEPVSYSAGALIVNKNQSPGELVESTVKLVESEFDFRASLKSQPTISQCRAGLIEHNHKCKDDSPVPGLNCRYDFNRWHIAQAASSHAISDAILGNNAIIAPLGLNSNSAAYFLKLLNSTDSIEQLNVAVSLDGESSLSLPDTAGFARLRPVFLSAGGLSAPMVFSSAVVFTEVNYALRKFAVRSYGPGFRARNEFSELSEFIKRLFSALSSNPAETLEQNTTQFLAVFSTASQLISDFRASPTYRRAIISGNDREKFFEGEDGIRANLQRIERLFVSRHNELEGALNQIAVYFNGKFKIAKFDPFALRVDPEGNCVGLGGSLIPCSLCLAVADSEVANQDGVVGSADAHHDCSSVGADSKLALGCPEEAEAQGSQSPDISDTQTQECPAGTERIFLPEGGWSCFSKQSLPDSVNGLDYPGIIEDNAPQTPPKNGGEKSCLPNAIR